MSVDSGGTSKPHKKRKVPGPLNDMSDEEEENKYAPYYKKNHIRNYPENSPGTVFPVYIQSINDDIKFGNKDAIYLNSIFSRYNKGVKEIKRVNAMRYAVYFDNPKNANSLLSNSAFLSSHEIKAYIPASNSERTGVIKHIPTDLSNKHLFDKLISSQEILSVRRFTKRTPEGITPLQTVSITFAGNVLPEHVSYGLCILPVEQYIKPVLQCYKCLGFGHTTKFCKRSLVCSICSESHSYKQCPNVNKPLCVNCKGDHVAVARICPVKQQKIDENKSKIMNKQTLGSFFPALNKSFAKAASNPHSQAIKKIKENKDTLIIDVINIEIVLNAIIDTLLTLSQKENKLPVNSTNIKEMFIKQISKAKNG